MNNSKICCSFCSEPIADVKKLIAAPDVRSHICDKCIEICYSEIHADPETKPAVKPQPQPKTKPKKNMSPREIKNFLDEYVIGQDSAKETISVAVYNHYKRLDNPIIDGVEIDKSNILIIGNTGVGKTYLVQTVARMLDVPFAMSDATSMTQAGYVGDDVESIVGRLLSASNNDVERTQRGIVFIDEIDKLKTRSASGTSVPEVGSEGVQQALLKMLEGNEIMVSPHGRKGPGSEMFKINTKNILFIVGGAFVGLKNIVEKSVNKVEPSGIGFGAKMQSTYKPTATELMKAIEPEHLVSFGLIPELIGRLPIVTVLEELTEASLVKILTEPKSAIVKQFVNMFKLDGVELRFTDDALMEIAKIAKTRKTGGRALRSVVEKALTRVQFNLPDLKINGATTITVTAGTIKSGDEPEILYAKTKKKVAKKIA